MPTPISVTCPACAASFRVPQPMAGKQVLCPQCKQPLIAPQAGSTPPRARKPAATPTRAWAILLLMLLTGLVGVGVGVAVVLLAMNGHWHDEPPAGKPSDPSQVAQKQSKDEHKPSKKKSPPQEKKQPNPDDTTKDSLKKDADKAKTQKQPDKSTTEPKEVSRLYLEALGKPERLAQVKGVRLEMTQHDPKGLASGVTEAWTWYSPDKFRVDWLLDKLGKGDKSSAALAINGQNGFYRMRDEKKTFSGQSAKQVRDGYVWIGVGQLTALASAKYQLTVLGPATVKGRPTTCVRMAAKGSAEIKLYFDRDSRLLAKAEYQGTWPTANFEKEVGPKLHFEVYFSDFRETDGIQQWRKVEIFQDGKAWGYLEVTAVRFLTEVDETIFSGSCQRNQRGHVKEIKGVRFGFHRNQT